MTMRTYYSVVCECGHEGKIKLSENDQPYSNSWESYSLEDLRGSSFSPSLESGSGWEVVFREMAISCPKCRSKLSAKNLVHK